jgi:small-conductance mechanosensitive channel
MSLREDLARLLPGERWLPYLIGLLVMASATAVLVATRGIVYRRLERRVPTAETRVDAFLLGLLGRTSVLFLGAVSMLLAVSVADLPAGVQRLCNRAAVLVSLVQAGIWLSFTLREVLERHFERSFGNGDDPTHRTMARMVMLGVRLTLWALLILVALSNLGVDITALVAGLGVGGVAVALATQNVLGDIFASVSILLDKPFVPGDFLVIDDFLGTVEHIGVKTTRLRSLGGEQLVFSNADLLRSRLRNYKRMSERRVLFKLGVVYQTPPDTLAAIPGLLRAAVEGQAGTRFDRSHFASYGDFALTFETVYYVLSADYNRYMDVQQAINLEIARRFADRGIEFAYPTQTLLLQRPAATAAVEAHRRSVSSLGG